MRFFCFLFLFFCCIFFNSCKKEQKVSPGENEIWLEYKAFNPSQLTIAAGTTVVFTNKDNASHTATESANLFDSGIIKSGMTYSYTFTNKGTYYFYCNYHSANVAEQGAILVQ